MSLTFRERLDRARLDIRSAERVVFFTGSGISAESGIPTFRDGNGLWSRYPPELFGNLPGLLRVAKRDPRVFASFLYDFLAPLVASKPNAAHFAISRLQKTKPTAVVTQNIDGLHQRAGTEQVIEIHGSMFERINTLTRQIKAIAPSEMKELLDRLAELRGNASSGMTVLRSLSPIASLNWTGLWLPNVVLFGQKLPPRAWNAAEREIRNCDCLVVVGTSRTVFPAASLVDTARGVSAKIIHVDLDAGHAEAGLSGSASSVLPDLCA